MIESKFKEWLWYWGESGTVCQIVISLFSETAGNGALSWAILLDKLAEICVANTWDDPENGFPDPYVTVSQVVEARITPASKPLDNKQFFGMSYHLAPLVYHAVRLDRRIALNELWKMVSKIYCCEYEPRNSWHYLLWRSDDGKEKGWYFNRAQSWSELKRIAEKTENSLPKSLKDNPAFLYPLLLVYPHRLTTEALTLAHESAISRFKGDKV
jgi:hypothetical protein